MHPPPFRLEHRLSDWPDCSLEMHCCKATIDYPVKLLLGRRGDMTFAALLSRLKCDRCNGKPAPVYLCAGPAREFSKGPPPDWAVELVPKPRA